MWAQRMAEEFLDVHGNKYTLAELIEMSDDYEWAACHAPHASLQERERAFRKWLVSIHVCCTRRTARREWTYVRNYAA